MPRSLRAHEALIVATHDISRQADVDDMGVSSEYLAQHPLTKDIGERDMNWAVGQARSAGWLLVDPLLSQDLGGKWSGLRLSHEGLSKVTELTRPWWHGLLSGFARDLRTVLIAAITAVVSAVVTVLILNLLT